ncbi:MAG: cadherin-like domain-containing protein [Proteobacteria bacterium]|nr:cadherin-like domain-containing protein [Pseudomonadota bacterium]
MATFNGNNNDNTINGSTSSDVINGHGGNDTLLGKSGSDLIAGGEGNDTIDGGDDDDFISGDADSIKSFFLGTKSSLTQSNYANVWGVNQGIEILARNVVNGVLSSASSANVGINSSGIGASGTTASRATVKQETGYDPINKVSEELIFKFHQDIMQAKVGLSLFYSSDSSADSRQNEVGKWVAYHDGVKVGEGVFVANSSSGSYEMTILPGVIFDELVFSALPYDNPQTAGLDTTQTITTDSSDFLVRYMDLIGVTMPAGSGNDVINGGNGNDTIFGNGGDDTLKGGSGDDIIAGGTGNDAISGEGGNDTLYGNEGDDVINGGAGNNTLYDGSGNDNVTGGTGKDTFYHNINENNNNVDIFNGGDGSDTLIEYVTQAQRDALQTAMIAFQSYNKSTPFDFSKYVPWSQLTIVNIENLQFTIIDNTAPVSVNDSNSVAENGTISVSSPGLLSNDSDVDLGDTLSIAKVNNMSANVGQQIALASGALVKVESNGSYAYNPNGKFDYLDTGQTATDSFTYTATDGHGGFSTATATITITGIANNHPPVSVDDSNTVAENGTISVSSPGLLNNDSDIDSGDKLSVAKVNNVSANVGQQIALASGALVKVESDGSYTYNPNGKFDYLDTGQTATDSFTYTATDGHGGFSTATATITITGIANNHPPVAEDDAYSITQNNVLIFGDTILLNDSDPDGDQLTLAYINNTPISEILTKGSITLSSGALIVLKGFLFYDSSVVFHPLQVGQFGTDSFTYTITDSHGLSDTATVTLTIAGLNDAPVSVNDSNTVAENSTISVSALGLLSNDSDIDLGDMLSVAKVNNVSANVGQEIAIASGALVKVESDGSYTYNPNGKFDYLDKGQTASDSFTYTATDGHGAFSTATATILITGVANNHPPVAGDDTYQTNQNTTVSIEEEILLNDFDPDAGDTISVTHVNGIPLEDIITNNLTLSSGAELQISKGFEYNPNHVFDYLKAGSSATDSFTYTITDSHGATDTATIFIDILGLNDTPIATADNYSTDEETPIQINIPDLMSNDFDIDTGDIIFLNAINGIDLNNLSGPINLSSGATLNIVNQTILYDPNHAFDSLTQGTEATDTFTYSIMDSLGATSTATVSVKISGLGTAGGGIGDGGGGGGPGPGGGGDPIGGLSQSLSVSSDKLIYDLAVNEGNNQISDFTSEDKLVFNNVVDGVGNDIADVDAQIASIVSESGNTKVNFKDPSNPNAVATSVVFNDVAFVGQTSIADVIPEQQIVVNH